MVKKVHLAPEIQQRNTVFIFNKWVSYQCYLLKLYICKKNLPFQSILFDGFTVETLKDVKSTPQQEFLHKNFKLLATHNILRINLFSESQLWNVYPQGGNRGRVIRLVERVYSTIPFPSKSTTVVLCVYLCVLCLYVQIWPRYDFELPLLSHSCKSANKHL